MHTLARTLTFACCITAAHAQTLLFEVHGDAEGDGFGASVRGAGDVDGDGHDDWIVGAPADDAAGTDAGSARVFSGATGAVLYTFYGSGPFDRLGFAVDGAGDVDADGRADLLVGAPGDFIVGQVAGSVSVFSGLDGSLLYRFVGDSVGDRFGAAARGAGDVDGDGHADVIVGAPQAAAGGVRPGMARVFSGIDGHVLFTVTGASDRDQLGYSVCAFDDIDGDGTRDVAAGAPLELDGEIVTGGIHAFSGASGQPVWSASGRYATGRFGHALSALSDVTGDGRPELVVGAPRAYYEQGVVHVLSGDTGTELYALTGTIRGGTLGDSVGTLRDWDGDGRGDIVAGADHDYTNGLVAGYAAIFSGIDGTLLFDQYGAVGSYFGFAVGGAGDTNGDGLSEVVIGGYRAHGNFGSVYVLTSVDCPPPATHCPITRNSAGPGARIAARGSTSIVRNDLTLTVDRCPPGQFGLFFYGTAAIKVPVGEGLLCVGGEVHRILPIVPLSAHGDASRTLDLTQMPHAVHAGETWHFQLWYRDPGGGPSGYDFSDALAVRFCP